MKLEKVRIGYKESLLEIDQLTIVPGKVYALIGANGRGKSTLLQTLIGKLPVLSGDIFIERKNLSEIPVTDKSKLFGLVHSKFSGIPYMRANEFVALGRTPYTNAFGRLTKKDLQIVEESMETLGITHLANRFTTELSDGERQMFAIARILAQETNYIFLDEPTAFLDYSNKKRVLEKLSEIAKSLNKSIVYSSHDLELALEFSDELVCIPHQGNKVTNFLNEEMGVKKVITICFE
ncbi:MAG: ABC transporter ATP-binding protein [Crocinitomicaceae bacterium]